MNIKIETILEHLNFDITQQEKAVIDANLKEYKSKINVGIDNGETEEHLKNIFSDYLKTIYSDSSFSVNTFGRADLAISENNEPKVLIETKKTNSPEMVSENNINKKSLHELFLYYLNTTRKFENNTVKRNPIATVQKLMITDFDKFYIFDAQEFDAICRYGVDEKFKEFKLQNLQGDRSEDFYALLKTYFDEIDITKKMKFYYFDFSENTRTQKGRINVYRLFSKESLLKKGFVPKASGNVLNVRFYNELLYIMGFVEQKRNGVSKIEINKNTNNTIASQIFKLLVSKGRTPLEAEEKAFELTVSWMNRLLFIKLFEGELKSFNGNSDVYNIFDSEKIKSFDDLYSLFFDVLGKRIEEREDNSFFDKFVNIPYLNSSLFEMTTTEMTYASVRELRNYDVDIYSKSIIHGVSKLPLLNYLVAFFAGYNFSQTDDDEQKDIINSSVLGLIFEKINGYKDGSFFTPYYITEFMAEGLVKRLILQKSSILFEREFASLDDLKFYVSDNLERCKALDEEIGKLRICDPSVGSGHFLVSVLNQILALKSDLGIIFYKGTNRRFSSYKLVVNNDILDVVNAQDERFTYNPSDIESQAIQETLFYEKRRIIENTLYGVDLNPNAVSICRLRLWIELLKNAYYKHNIMVTLPNIDVNIAVGNSLTFKIPFDYGCQVSSGSFTDRQLEALAEYKELNKKYIAENNKEIKREIKRKIDRVKKTLTRSQRTISLFDDDFDDEEEIIKDSSFEWGIEFPELLNEKGEFEGFDGVIANPPYIGEDGNSKYFKDVKKSLLGTAFYMGKMDMLYFFLHLALKILKKNGYSSFITTNYFVTADGALKLRNDLKIKSTLLELINFNELKVFDSAIGQSNLITIFNKSLNPDKECKIINLEGNEKLFSLENVKEKLKPLYENDSDLTTFVKNKDLYYSKSNFIALRQVKDSDLEERKIIDYISKCESTLESVADVAQGLISGANNMSPSLMSKVDSSVVDKADGIFILDLNNERDVAFINSLNDTEKDLLEPYFKNSDIRQYDCEVTPTKYVIYTGRKTLNEESYPHIISHFEKFRKITERRRENVKGLINFYQMQWPRTKELFQKEKIVLPYRSQLNGFALNNVPWFFSTDCYSISKKEDSKISLKYLLGILNSKTYRIYFSKRGKMKGDVFEFMYTNLCQTPIVLMSHDKMQLVEEKVDEIINAICNDSSFNIEESESFKKIDEMLKEQIDKDEVIKIDYFDQW